MNNILFIECDSMDGRAMGCMGHAALAQGTPHLDALARSGTLFSTAYCNSPICVPSRSSQWSGRYTHRCQGWNNFKGLEPGMPTWETALAAAGYRVGMFGKTDYLSGHHTQRARVSPWTRCAQIERPNYRTPLPVVLPNNTPRVTQRDWDAADRAIAFLKESRAADEPFCCYFGPNAPHPPFKSSRRYLDLIDRARITLPGDDTDADHPAMRYQRINKGWEHGFDADLVRRVRHVYYAMIAEVDAMVDHVLGALDQLGLRENTYVIFTSDHGELAMEHRQVYKMSLYEPSARVPLMIAGPGVQAGQTIERPVMLVDLYPTLMAMADQPIPAGLDGHSLLPEATGQPAGDLPDYAFAECHDSSCCTGAFMLRRGDWKLIAHAGLPSQLFNLRDDPGELRNLAGARPDVLADMDRRLRRVCDYESVDAQVKAYDRASFAQWREAHCAAGDYDRLMSVIFSGYDGVTPETATPWRPEDEAQILEWLDD